jgi:Fe-S cluster assembly scaffold protein SufB
LKASKGMGMNEEKERKLAEKYFKRLNFERKESPSGYYLNFNSLDVKDFLKESKVQKKPTQEVEAQENSLIFLDNTLLTKEKFHKAKKEKFGFDFRKNKFEAFNLAFYKAGISIKINKDLKLSFISKTSQIVRNFFLIENANVKIVEFYTGEGFSSINNKFLIKNSIVEHELINNDSSKSFVQDSFKLEASKLTQRSFIKARKELNLKAFNFEVLESDVIQKASIINSGSQLWVSNFGKAVEKSSIDISLRGVFSNSSTFFESFLESDKKANGSNMNIEIKGIKEKNAKVFCVPSLSIKNKNCNAKHSFSTVELEKGEFEYLKAKGIDNKTIKKIVKENILRWWKL